MRTLYASLLVGAAALLAAGVTAQNNGGRQAEIDWFDAGDCSGDPTTVTVNSGVCNIQNNAS